MRRYHIRPTKEMRPLGIAFSILYIVVACVFVIIGVTQVIPSGAGLFGVLWTGMALCFAAFGVYNLVRALRSKDGSGLYGVEIVDESAPSSPAGGSAEQRLQELRSLYDRSLITEEEYEEKRREILRDL
ncbi:SHOCT domain-containing protein [Oscillibacter sp. MSJ-2]|uniref:SHOCT domain-containing protein n=1 Tax=Dysosmobacter acutus TaxID=2841504 RepID=A0ABS6F623_9FIRM|nr:SHOCT domain-containing protein [Dysosmobacter acutus]MBU5625744.1 SHOCT domain-containing protein [Dysosmobacter acutus]